MLGEKVNMKTTSNNAITCSTDYNYLKFLYPFLDSLFSVNSKLDIFVRLVDFTENQIEEVKNKFDNIELIIDNPNLSEKRTLFKTKEKYEIKNLYNIKNILGLRKVLYSPRSFYTCHSRFLSINELLQKNYNVLSLDVDTLVLKNFDNIFNKLESDIYSVISPLDDDKFCNEGFLLFKNNNKVKDLINKINNYIFTEGNYINWNADHYALHTFFNENELSLKLLDSKYKDKAHNIDSIMWSGDGAKKFKETFSKKCQT